MSNLVDAMVDVLQDIAETISSDPRGGGSCKYEIVADSRRTSGIYERNGLSRHHVERIERIERIERFGRSGHSVRLELDVGAVDYGHFLRVENFKNYANRKWPGCFSSNCASRVPESAHGITL